MHSVYRVYVFACVCRSVCLSVCLSVRLSVCECVRVADSVSAKVLCLTVCQFHFTLYD